MSYDHRQPLERPLQLPQTSNELAKEVPWSYKKQCA